MTAGPPCEEAITPTFPTLPPPTADLRAQWRAVAKKAIDASLELADELEAA